LNNVGLMRKSQRRFLELMIILALFLLGVGIITVAENSAAIYPYVLIGIGGLLLIGLFMVAVAFNRERAISINERDVDINTLDERDEEAYEIYKQRVEEAIQRAIGKQERVPITEDMTVIEYTKALDKDVCMVCKLFLSKKDKILQCPICESLYHRDHLLEWITVKKKCPVCSQDLYKK
jgi:hypothetical protein